jgi:hypothetical protein
LRANGRERTDFKEEEESATTTHPSIHMSMYNLLYFQTRLFPHNTNRTSVSENTCMYVCNSFPIPDFRARKPTPDPSPMHLETFQALLYHAMANEAMSPPATEQSSTLINTRLLETPTPLWTFAHFAFSTHRAPT